MRKVERCSTTSRIAVDFPMGMRAWVSIMDRVSIRPLVVVVVVVVVVVATMILAEKTIMVTAIAAIAIITIITTVPVPVWIRNSSNKSK